jgi:hypothetical protein
MNIHLSDFFERSGTSYTDLDVGVNVNIEGSLSKEVRVLRINIPIC